MHSASQTQHPVQEFTSAIPTIPAGESTALAKEAEAEQGPSLQSVSSNDGERLIADRSSATSRDVRVVLAAWPWKFSNKSRQQPGNGVPSYETMIASLGVSPTLIPDNPQLRAISRRSKLTQQHTSFAEFQKALLVPGFDPDEQFHGAPLIIHAVLAYEDTEAKIALLLQHGANPNGRHMTDGTGLHILLANECHELALYFLEQASVPGRPHRFNIDALDMRGNTPLLLAVKTGANTVASALTHRGARCDAIDSAGRTPLHCATILGNVEVVDLMRKQAPACFRMKDKFGRTPIDYLALPPAQRRQNASELLASVHIDASRDEHAWQNKLIDKDWGSVKYRGREVQSTKEEATQLMRLLGAFGPVICDNLSYNMASIAYIAQQAVNFTGRSLLETCIHGQDTLLREYASRYAETRMRDLITRKEGDEQGVRVNQ